MEFEIKKNPCKKNSGNRRKKKEKKKKWVVFVFFKTFHIFSNPIDIFAGYRGSAGQFFFRILAKEHFTFEKNYACILLYTSLLLPKEAN